MLNLITPAMAVVLKNHYKQLLSLAKSADQKIIVARQLQYYSNIEEKFRSPRKVFTL